jgi:hypothetical protein
MPFQFHCMESRLKIERIAHRGKNGEELTEKSTEEPTTVELTVRNFSDVPAVGVAVSLRPYGQRMELQATGPERVEPYAVGEYTADFHAPSRFTSPKRKTEYRAACTNCTGVATGKR